MIGNIADPRIADAVGSLFGNASGAVRENVNESFDAEERGERATREDSYTEDIVRIMRRTINNWLEEYGRRVSELGVDIAVEFTPSQLPVKDETEYGADIGIRATIRTPRVVILKGMLIQCKRMYGPLSNPSFPELRGRGERQARSMLRMTPASFYMLFNAGDQGTLLNYTSVPGGTLCPYDSFELIRSSKREEIGSNCPYWMRSSGSIWDLGVAILPASRVLALSAASQLSGSPIPVDASTILRGCLPFGVFMVDLFASCFVGDPRDSIVRLVTPPALRNNYPAVGLTDSDFDDFAVRYYLDVSITHEGPQSQRTNR